MFSQTLQNDAKNLIELCRQKNIILTTAESCTGGLIIGLLTEIAGASDAVDRGFITYSNEAKVQLLGVSHDILKQYGAVSEQTVRAMTEGALKNSNADIAVAVSGIAGPGGGRKEKPIGLVHIAVQFGKHINHEKCLFGDIGRSQVREKTIQKSLEMIELTIHGK